jgi:hypothetical protein
LDRVVTVAIGLIAATLLITAFGQVIARYLAGQPFSWVLEFDVRSRCSPDISACGGGCIWPSTL